MNLIYRRAVMVGGVLDGHEQSVSTICLCGQEEPSSALKFNVTGKVVWYLRDESVTEEPYVYRPGEIVRKEPDAEEPA